MGNAFKKNFTLFLSKNVFYSYAKLENIEIWLLQLQQSLLSGSTPVVIELNIEKHSRPTNYSTIEDWNEVKYKRHRAFIPQYDTIIK